MRQFDSAVDLAGLLISRGEQSRKSVSASAERDKKNRLKRGGRKESASLPALSLV